MTMHDDDYRRRARFRILNDLHRRHAERRRLRWLAFIVAVVLLVVIGCVENRMRVAIAAEDSTAIAGCSAAMAWPVEDPMVMRSFDGPAQPWLSGHRGVDLAATEGDTLIAPADGVISYAGSVAGKSVVSIAYRGLTLTFEPARTLLEVGAHVRRGVPFATVSGLSDHCDGRCVHWGIKRGARDYLDPELQVGNRRIALKPVLTSATANRAPPSLVSVTH